MLNEASSLILTNKGFKSIIDLAECCEDVSLATIVDGKLSYVTSYEIKEVVPDGIYIYDSSKNFSTATSTYCRFYSGGFREAYTLKEIVEKNGSSSVMLSCDVHLNDSKEIESIKDRPYTLDFDEDIYLTFKHKDVIKLLLLYYLSNNTKKIEDNSELLFFCYSKLDHENLFNLLNLIFCVYEEDYLVISDRLAKYYPINYKNNSPLYGMFKIESEALKQYKHRLSDINSFIRNNPNYVISILKELSDKSCDNRWKLNFSSINNPILYTLAEILVLSGYKVFIQKHRYINSLTFIKNDRGKVSEHLLKDAKNIKYSTYVDIVTPAPTPIFVLDLYNKKMGITIRQTN